ncbi:unnamed protein product [Adineta ricciae]|uniref:Uncharacterized protein n=1 Tax=Adineta ricciae TaxID=249248 RepID=A0A816FXQ6_ADIRI|nr:unnamed protein product [Adineta ricciae]
MAFIVGNSQSKNTYSMSISGDGSDVKFNIMDTAAKANNTPVQAVMNSAGKTASKIIESGGDLLTAPVVWLKDMQQNWIMYMVVLAVILGSIAFLYCAFLFYCNRKTNSTDQNQLIELAKIIGNKIGTAQSPLAIMTPTPSSLP